MEPTGGDLARHDREFEHVRWIGFDEAPGAPDVRDRAGARRASGRGSHAAGAIGRGADGWPRRAVGTAPGMTDAAAPSHATPLPARHEALGARMIEFGGWLMPRPVRAASSRSIARSASRAGLFDLSHMGELFVEGPEAGDGARRARWSPIRRPSRWAARTTR